MNSSVRRIFERGGGAGTKNKFLHSEPIRFSTKIRWRPKKKRSSLNISPVLAQNYVKIKHKKKKVGLYPDSVLLCAQTFCPSYRGGGHAAILYTILC